jgi:hypothetical protein
MNVVILNDTSFQNHFGCELVMKTFREQLSRLGFKLIKTIPTGVVNFSIPKQTDMVIVNGEGTIHHGSSGHLIYVVEKYPEIPFVLLNAVWQENPDYKCLDKFKYISVRESFSFNSMQKNVKNIEVIPDIMFACKYAQNLALDLNKISPTIDIGVTDNVVPTSQFNISSRTTASNFIRSMCQYKRICSGRHHGVAVAAILNKPFSAWPSNTHKIEGMMTDMGVEKFHFKNQFEAIKNIPIKPIPAVADYVKNARLKITKMFDELEYKL